MKLYTDIINNRQIISDGQKFTLDPETNVMKVKSKLIVLKEDEVDVGCGNAFGGEQAQKQEDKNAQKVNDLLHRCLYQQAYFDADRIGQVLKLFAKKGLERVKGKPEQEAKYKEQAKNFVTFVKKNHQKITYYIQKEEDQYNQKGAYPIVSLFEQQEDDAPTFYYFLPFLKEQKV